MINNSSNIAALEAQIKLLQNNIGQKSLPPPEPQNGLTVDQIKQIVVSILDEYGLVNKPDIAQEMDIIDGEIIVPEKNYTLMEAIGVALTNDEQLWVSKPEVLHELPNFIISKLGQDHIKTLMKDFRSFYENKKRSNSK